MWSRGIRRSDLERLLHDFEAKLPRQAGWRRVEAPRAVETMGDVVAAALSDVAERFSRGTRNVRNADVAQLGDEALEFGNRALRRLSREVEHRPLVTLAVAVGVGALVLGLLARRD